MTSIFLKINPGYSDWEKEYETGDTLQQSVVSQRGKKFPVPGKEDIMPVVTNEQIQKLISSDKVVIFSKKTCPYCQLAKKVFDGMQQKYTVIELDEREDGPEIQSILGEITGASTVPRVFLNGECLGGGTDVKKLYDSGELQKKL